MVSLKKLLALLLSAMLLMTTLPAVTFAEELEFGDTEETEIIDEAAEETEEEVSESEEEDGESESEAEEEEEIVYPDELIVGHTTVTKGDFFTEMFGNDTADIDVRALIHGYNLVNWDQNQGVYVLDPSVVTDCEVVLDEVGNKTYYLALADDLFYSDGTPITAWDYAFSLLLMMSPEIEQFGGKIYRAEHILGFDEYITKQAYCLGGVEVLSDHQLAITLDHEFLPYFFEIGLLLCVPYPIHVIAPGCKVYDDGWGVYIGNADKSMKEPLYTAELLEKTILDPETGYNSHPSVVSGPYTMVSYDMETGESHFQINPYYKGTWFHNSLPGFASTGVGPTFVEMLDAEGEVMLDTKGNQMYLVKPSIEKICFTLADNGTMIQKLKDGELHLVNKVTYGPTILEGLQNGDSINFQNYPRIGLSFLTFSYDWPTVNDMQVRQAIAWCMNRKQLTQDYCQGYGQVVDGYYGIEQWEYMLVNGRLEYPVNFIDDPSRYESEELDEMLSHKYRYVTTDEEYETALAAWEMLSLDNLVKYGVDEEGLWQKKANALLNDAGWTLNRDGEKYKEGDDVRAKMIDDKLVTLDLKMMYPEGNHIVDTLQENFIDNLNAVGITLELVPTPMEDLLRSYYRQTERTTDMIYLATNFHVIVDPSITYSTDTSLNHEIWNNTYSDDEDLYYRAVNMRKTDPMDVYDYVSKWVSFQERYNLVLPTIPVYSNIYFDFFTPMLQNYYITGQVTWSQAIVLSYFGEAYQEPEAEEGEEEEGEEFEEFD